jgi:hypothetical protein
MIGVAPEVIVMAAIVRVTSGAAMAVELASAAIGMHRPTAAAMGYMAFASAAMGDMASATAAPGYMAASASAASANQRYKIATRPPSICAWADCFETGEQR